LEVQRMETLILAEGILTPSCSKSHISYLFNLEKNRDRLEILFSYEPKKLEDREKSKALIIEGIRNYVDFDQDRILEGWETYLPVQNLLTLSIDDSGQFRGCAHRQGAEQHLFIEKDNASPGLIPGNLTPGQWRVTISIHAVVSDSCKYKLHVLEVAR
jgi:hypothetical protein